MRAEKGATSGARMLRLVQLLSRVRKSMCTIRPGVECAKDAHCGGVDYGSLRSELETLCQEVWINAAIR